ncbi:MAG: DUF1573 domain-containing protein [Chitinophagales bacterium]
MKSIYSLLIWVTFFAAMNCSAQGEFRKDVAYIVNEQGEMVETYRPVLAFLPSSSYEFGTVEEGTVVEHDFTIINTGKTPLIINDVRGTCHCTAADWTKTPILPNEKGTIKLMFKTIGKSGRVASSLNIYSNGFYAEEQAFVRGTVVKKEEVSKVPQSAVLPRKL